MSKFQNTYCSQCGKDLGQGNAGVSHCDEHESNLIERLKRRATIRRQISSRKSVQEGKPDRIADLLEEAAAEIERLGAGYRVEDLDIPSFLRAGKLPKELVRMEEKLLLDTGRGCSVCGQTPVVNVEGGYWLCGPCVLERLNDPVRFAGAMAGEHEEMVAAAHALGKWMSAALDDPSVCEEMKRDINAWFDTGMPFVSGKWSMSRIRALEGLPQDALDGGWTYVGMNAYTKQLEDRLQIIADIAEGSTSANSLPNIARIARGAAIPKQPETNLPIGDK